MHEHRMTIARPCALSLRALTSCRGDCASCPASDAHRFATDGDPDDLERSLLALSLEDGVTDCRDTYVALMHLLDCARHHDVDASSILRRVASLSSERMRHLLETQTLDMASFRA
jgi:citrate lyase beta subunit